MVNISLAGNPNVGKTTVFNRLTKSFEHVGNWHGVTVDAASKEISFEGERLIITDLPGIYSLTPYSGEECISRDAIYTGGDLIVNVCDAGNLARNLYLTLQLLEYGANVVLAVNMVNELSRDTKLSYEKLSRTLGIKVVPIDLKFGDELLTEALDALKNKQKAAKLVYLDKLPLDDISRVIKDNAYLAGIPERYAVVKILEGDAYITEKLNLTERQMRELAKYKDRQAEVAAARYGYIDKILSEVFTYSGNEKNDRLGIDRILLNKYLALPVFALIIFSIFIIIFGEFRFGDITVGFIGYWLKFALSAFIENCIKLPMSSALTDADALPWVTGLVTDGIIGGMASVLIFLPQIVLLFFFLALLEDSGYISRVAFMTDGLFQKIGLSGRSVFTMLMGFGCSATAVLTARGLDDDMMRKKTVALTPFMSCSAKLPVYLAICSAYFAAGQVFVIIGMYLIGIGVSVAYAAIGQRISRFKSGSTGFIMELPPYRFPSGARIFQLLWHNAKTFVIRVGTAVFLLSAVVWLLSHFTFGFVYTGNSTEGSMLWHIAGAVSFIFAPLGFGNANAAAALISGLVAKEAVISTVDALGGINTVFTGQFASASAFSFLVFTLLYIPCIATLTATAKETGVKWMFFCSALQLFAAYTLALISYWTGVLFISHTGIAVTVFAVITVALLAAAAASYLLKNKEKPCGACRKKCKSRKSCGYKGE